MELKGPGEAEIKKIIRLDMDVDFTLVNSKNFKGKLLWADNSAFHLKLENDKTITLLRSAVAYYSAE